MKKQRIFVAFILVILIFTAVQLMKSIGETFSHKGKEENVVKMALIVKNERGEYWRTMVMGAQMAAKERGIVLQVMAPKEEADYREQSHMIFRAVDTGCEAVILAPADLLLLEPALLYAKEKKVPVILLDALVYTDAYSRSFTTDNLKAGEQLGALAVKMAGKNMKVGIINFVSGSGNAIEREKGLREYLKQYENVSIRDTMYSMSDANLAAKITDFMLHELNPPQVIIGLDAVSTLGIAREVSRYAPSEQIFVLGFDSTPQEVGYLESGIIDGTIVQNPFNMGYLGVKEANLFVQNPKRKPKDEKNVHINTVVIDKDNLYNPTNEKLVFPFSY